VSEAIDGFRYISYVGSRWRWIALSSAVAVAIALVVSLSMPREYTATARIVIDPPAGADVRAATTAVSPIYFESLKTYESFAAGDTLFQKAIAPFDLRAQLGARPIEAIKKRVLKVGIVRNTRILEISATLPNPRTAQALAQFIAESTAAENRSLSNEGDRDLIHGLEGEESQARAKLEQVDADWARLLGAEPVEQLQAALSNSSDLRAKLEEQASGAQLEIADAAQREKQAPASELAQIRADSSEAHTRVEEIRKQMDALDRQDAERQKLLAARTAHRDRLDAERKAQQSALSAIESRLMQARGDAGYRGERLKIIDPGIVPERPSSPNISLNLAAALLLGFTLPVLYFAVEINFQELRIRARRGVHALARHE
jgi:succinoglycan biosynthesis transport protein ExoP